MQRGGLAPRVAAEQPDLAGVLAEQAEQDPDSRRLAGAVGSEETVHLAAGDREVEPVQGPGRAEGLDEPGNLDDGFVHLTSNYTLFQYFLKSRRITSCVDP